MQFFRNLYFEFKWLFEEIAILLKHPTRKASWKDVRYHHYKIWCHLIFEPYNYFKRGIRNLWVWFPIIWRTDVFDYSYLLDIMDQQMKDMEKFFLSDNTWGSRTKRDGKRIKHTRKLMKLWHEEYYSMLEYEKHKLKFPDEGLFTESSVSQTDEYGIPTLYKCKVTSPDCSDDFCKHSDIGRKLDDKAFKYWLKGMSKIRQWWD